MKDSEDQPARAGGPPNDADPSDANELSYRVAAGTAMVAAVFSVIVSMLLIFDYVRRQGDDPQEVAALKTLKAALKQAPANDKLNDKLKEHIQKLDLQLNTELRDQHRFAALGGLLLLGGVVVFLGSAIAAATLRRRAPMPGAHAPPPDLDMKTARVGSWMVGVLAAVLVLLVIGLNLLHQSPLSQSEEELLAPSKDPKPESGPDNGDPPPVTPKEPPPTASTDPYEPPPAEEIARWWPRFRGPGGSGHSQYTDVPTTWNAATGENIRWKTPVPLPGNSSPVVWGDRVFLSGATKDKRQVYCFDAKDGKLLWQRDITAEAARLRRELKAAINTEDYEKAVEIIEQIKPPTFFQDTGYAAPTVAADGHNVFAIFASGDIAAVNFNGAIAWQRTLGTPENSYGHASSLAMYKNLVLVQFDQGTKKQRKSKLLALNAANGETVWQVDREVPHSWSSPIVVGAAGRQQLLTAADPWVIAYNPADGKELWRANCLRQDVGPSPVCQEDVVFVAVEYRIASAIRADGSGDVTDTHILWQGEDGLPDTCSPLATGEFLFLVAADTLTCYDIKTGKMLWEEYKTFKDATFTSSPSLVGNRLYLIAKGEEMDPEDGEEKPRFVQKSFVVEPNRDGCKLIGEATLGEECVTSPAFQQGCFYLRGKDNLYCIGKPLAASQ